MDELVDVQDKWFKLQKKFSEYTFRLKDNMNQELKGQPSLDVEDDKKEFLDQKIKN